MVSWRRSLSCCFTATGAGSTPPRPLASRGSHRKEEVRFYCERGSGRRVLQLGRRPVVSPGRLGGRVGSLRERLRLCHAAGLGLVEGGRGPGGAFRGACSFAFSVLAESCCGALWPAWLGLAGGVVAAPALLGVSRRLQGGGGSPQRMLVPTRRSWRLQGWSAVQRGRGASSGVAAVRGGGWDGNRRVAVVGAAGRECPDGRGARCGRVQGQPGGRPPCGVRPRRAAWLV